MFLLMQLYPQLMAFLITAVADGDFAADAVSAVAGILDAAGIHAVAHFHLLTDVGRIRSYLTDVIKIVFAVLMLSF
jgi:hypothetical protein